MEKFFKQYMRVVLIISVILFFMACNSDGESTKTDDNSHKQEHKKGVETFNINGVKFNMIKVDGGTFMMGSLAPGHADEWPVHEVTLSDYYIGETEVTQELWEAVMDKNPSYYVEKDLPIHGVSWDRCNQFIEKLCALTGKNFRLPTEAEWEFAAKGGNLTNNYIYSGSNNLDDVAWWNGQGFEYKPCKGCLKKPNELGIYDMSGNVEEWCLDWYDNYRDWPQSNPAGPSIGTFGSSHVCRGGCWYSDSSSCRTTSRKSTEQYYTGFRLALGNDSLSYYNESKLPTFSDISFSEESLLTNHQVTATAVQYSKGVLLDRVEYRWYANMYEPNDSTMSFVNAVLYTDNSTNPTCTFKTPEYPGRYRITFHGRYNISGQSTNRTISGTFPSGYATYVYTPLMGEVTLVKSFIVYSPR